MMAFLEGLAHRIVDDLVRNDVVKGEDAAIYIYGINQILTYALNVSSALMIGMMFGVLLEVAVFMAAYIPLRSFAGGYHAKTPLRCYIFSVIILIFVSLGMRYLTLTEWAYYVILPAAALVVLVLSPVEDRNKPLDETERRVYKKRAALIAVAELMIGLVFKLIGLDSLFVAMVYSFAVLCFMLVIGAVKNKCRLKQDV